MTPITDMALPDAIMQIAADAFLTSPSGRRYEPLRTAIRAALQAMLDNGMAVIEDREDWENSLQSIKRSTFLVVRLDADERKRALQEERK